MTDREKDLIEMVERLTKDLQQAADMIRQLAQLRWATFAIVFLSGGICGVVLYVGTR